MTANGRTVLKSQVANGRFAYRQWHSTAIAYAVVIALSGCGAPRHASVSEEKAATRPSLDAPFHDDSNGDDWPAYGRTYGEQHFSPLRDINTDTVSNLSLAWSMDLDQGNPASVPLAVDGTLYFTTGLAVVHAVDAVSGKPGWTYDPKVAEAAPDLVRPGWGTRGLAYWNGKVYIGTQDGRLIALDAKTGQVIWSVQTTTKGDGRYISGAPRVFAGKIIVGHGGADTSDNRGYVTTYDAESGKQLWRFFITPGDPAKGFEDEAQAMAAKTWRGAWWKFGGGGAVWNAITYDADFDTILIGTGNGAPWNQRIRSPGGGDNLFLASVVALDAKTGKLKWYYQFNPGEMWDYNASMDMQLADLVIEGKLRKVVMEAPKNGFFYVIDRTNGKLISAEKITKVTWASKIDLTTGRPVEVPGARFPNGQDFTMFPSYTGAHSWMPSAYSPQTKLIYIPVITSGAVYNDRGIDVTNWRRPGGNLPGLGVNVDPTAVKDPQQNTSKLLAWDPARQTPAWSVKTIGGWNGGLLATGGNLVFQGQLNGRFSAYAADKGKELWHFPAQAAVIGAPITYRAGGHQYVTLLVGIGTSVAGDASTHGGLQFDYRTQRKRVLTFALGGTASLPPPEKPFRVEGVADETYRPDQARADRGAAVYNARCIGCHGLGAVSGGGAPDLRASPVVQSAEAFSSVLHDGALLDAGMPHFEELSPSELEALRQYLRSRGADLRAGRP